MIGSIYATARGALILQTRLDAISNNLANASTAGFKKSMVVFHDPASKGRATPSGQPALPQGGGDRSLSDLPLRTLTDFTPGPVKPTGNPLDFAIEGDGFFCVETPQGIRYTRKGSFIVNKDKELATKEGYPVQGTSGKLVIEGAALTVSAAGVVSVDGIVTGTLKVVQFPDPQSVVREGESFFSGEGAVTAKDITLHQGFLEDSNVNPIRTMAEMVDVLRGFESYQKILQSLNEANTKLIQDVAKQNQ